MPEVEGAVLEDAELEESGASAAAEPTPPPDEGEAEGTGNAWQDMKSAIHGISDEDAPAPTAEAGAEDGQRPEAEAEDPKTEETEQQSKPEQAGPRRFEITDAQGNGYELDWPEGTQVRFKADGRELNVDSLDGLVVLAQKGVAFDRKSSEFGTRERRFRDAEAEFQAARSEFDETLVKVLFDKEAFQAARKALAPFRDPAVREAAAKAEKLDAREAHDAEQHAAQRTEVVSAFWGRVGQEFDTRLGEYELLDADDKQEVVEYFYALLEADYNTATEQLRARHPDADEEEIAAAAERHAFSQATEARFGGVMQELNARYEKRLGARRDNNGADPAKAEAEAAKHNNYVDQKLEQRSERRGIRAGGAPPGSVRPRQAEPTSWDEHKQAWKNELRSLQK